MAQVNWITESELSIADDLTTAGLVTDAASDTRAAMQLITNALLSAAIAADPTLAANVSDAASVAVAYEIVARNLIAGTDTRVPAYRTNLPGLAAAITTITNQRTWLEANDKDGGPSPWSETLFRDVLKMFSSSAASPYMLALADPTTSRLTELVIRATDGKFDDFAVEGINTRGRVFERPYMNIPYTPGSDIFPVFANRDRVTVWGESNATNLAQVLIALRAAEMPGVTVVNDEGQAGTTPDENAARNGALPALLEFPGNTIPASGFVDVFSPSRITSGVTKTYTGWVTALDGTIVHGTLSCPNSVTLRFTRTTAGAALAVAPDVPFVSEKGRNYRADTLIIQTGKNDGEYADGATRAIRAVDRMFNFAAAQQKQVLVIGPWDNIGQEPAKTVNMAKINAAWAARYGAAFIDMRAWLASPQVWTDTGISPTSDDLAAQAAFTIPPSLAEPDGAHLKSGAVRYAQARLVIARLRALNWIS